MSRNPAVRCSARSSQSGEACRAYAVVGATVCVAHGGRAPQVRAAARRRVTERRALETLARQGKQPIASIPEELHATAAEIVNFKDFLRDHLGHLRTIARVDKIGREELRASIQAYERALDRTVQRLTDIARLRIDERLAAMADREMNLVGPWVIWLTESTVVATGAVMSEERWSAVRELATRMIEGIFDAAPAPARPVIPAVTRSRPRISIDRRST